MVKKVAVVFTILTICIFIVLTIQLCSTELLANEYIFDFGTILTGSEIRHTFNIPQKGNDTLSIKDAYSTCDCIHILSYPQKIDPHENGKLEVRLIPFELGEVAYEIILETGNSHTPALRYGLKGTIKEGIFPEGENRTRIEIPAKMFTRQLKKRNPAFLITVDSVLEKLRAKQDLILIDVRNSKEFEKFKIPGSINIPLFSIKSKTFLKPKSLVLFNEGYSYTQLEKECKNLRDSGFKVSIMNGGLYHWKQKEAPLEGNGFAQKELNKISPRIFFTEKNYEHWIVIDSSQSKESESRYLMPQGMRLPHSDDPKQLVVKLKSVLEKHIEGPSSYVLIFDDHGEYYEKIEKYFQKAGIEHVFYLKGGLEGYKAFLQQQASIWQQKGNKRKSVKKCATCP